eukprot:scaffold131344_cov60-Phaeocystis_antarctica.AAC.1
MVRVAIVSEAIVSVAVVSVATVSEAVVSVAVVSEVAYRARGEREQLCLQRVAIGGEILRTAPPLLSTPALVAQLDRLLRG